MKPESGAFADQARIVLARAERMLGIGLNEDAARAAYMASFHAAQAYIFERTGKISKSHKGLQIEFFRLTKDDGRVDHALKQFLSRAYDFKSVADYFTGPDAITSAHEAKNAVYMSKQFVVHFAGLISHPINDPDANIAP